jgi:hypothetical protein
MLWILVRSFFTNISSSPSAAAKSFPRINCGFSPESAVSPKRRSFHFRNDAMRISQRTLFLFQYGATDLYALSSDPTGCNLPQDGHAWLLRANLAESDIDEVARDEVSKNGYCILEGQLET